MKVLLVGEGFGVDTGVGVERYSWELLAGLKKLGVGVKAVSSDPSRRRYSLAANAVAKLPFSVFEGIDNTNIIHSTDPSSALALPFTGRRTLVTFHDLMPFLLRDGSYGTGNRMFSLFVYRVASMCDAIIAVSEQTKQEVIKYLGVPEGKIQVIHQGVSDVFRILPAVQKRNLIGYVGDITPRKRIDLLIRGFHLLKTHYSTDAKLIIVGSSIAEHLREEKVKLMRLVQQLDLQESVIFTGHVSTERLVELYNEIKVLVLPSEYEGFGFPIVEAERCGTPVIVRKGVRISPEVSSECLSVGSAEDLAQTACDLILDPELYENRRRAAIEHSRLFTWEKCVAKTAHAYNILLD
jgi:glycosyltransferase involved in cell wall biosynthesis